MSSTPPPTRRSNRLQDIVTGEQEQELGEFAVRRGLLTETRLEEARREQEGSTPRRGLGEILMARGWVTPEQWIEHREAHAREEFARAARKKYESLPVEARSAAEDPSRTLGEYVLVSRVGRGGGGEVWRAWDRSLSRWVAIKRPSKTPESRTDWERFQREALAAARLSHPNLVPIFRVAPEAETPYIVMQLVEGRTLADERPPLRRTLEVMRTAALAVHYAHQNGVVHRDLKPGNLMLDGGGGVWVLDFGVAHLPGATQATTATGTISGTPVYMSPEQARGDREAREALADVYCLGATLYDLTAGRPPFEGTTFAEVIHKVIHDDPAPPRRIVPGLPREVETIILKAMDKDPARRYPSAAAFAEDLRRFLEEEPIAARPTGRLYRAYRWVRKNPIASGLGAGLVVVLIAAVSFGVAGEGQRQDALRSIREKAHQSLETALKFRRLGANREMREYLPALESAYREAVERQPQLAEVEYLMGRMYRALMENEKALEYQERALRKDPDYAPALYERAVLLARMHSGMLARTEEITRELREAPVTARIARTARTPTLDEAEHRRPELIRARERILNDCARLERALKDHPDRWSEVAFTGARLLAAKGIMEAFRRNYAEAVETLRKAVKQDPLLEEAWETLANVLARKAEAEGAGDEETWRERESLYEEALSRDRGYLPHLIRLAEVRIMRGGRFRNTGRDPLPDYAAAENDLSRALMLDRSYVGAWRTRGIIRSGRARYREERSQDPLPDLAAAEADFTEALRLRPSYVEVWFRRAGLRISRGRLRRRQDGDPGPDFAEAERDLAEARRLDATFAGGWQLSGYLLLQRGILKMERGENPLEEFASAETSLTEALRLDREYGTAWKNRGIMRARRGDAQANQGEDPNADFEAAVDDLTEALRLNPGYADAWMERGHVRLRLGRYRERVGDVDQASEDYLLAVRDYTEAVRINPALADTLRSPLATARDRASRLK